MNFHVVTCPVDFSRSAGFFLARFRMNHRNTSASPKALVEDPLFVKLGSMILGESRPGNPQKVAFRKGNGIVKISGES